eukprot:124307-Rhodomonas_salina.7
MPQVTQPQDSVSHSFPRPPCPLFAVRCAQFHVVRQLQAPECPDHLGSGLGFRVGDDVFAADLDGAYFLEQRCARGIHFFFVLAS